MERVNKRDKLSALPIYKRSNPNQLPVNVRVITSPHPFQQIEDWDWRHRKLVFYDWRSLFHMTTVKAANQR
jgi:hypothetical protein